MGRLLLHVALTLSLFLLVNWIGRGLYSKGYMRMHLMPVYDSAPLLNAGIRIVTPLVYLVLVSASLYGLGWDEFVEGIYWVGLYYVLFRWVFNVAWGRAGLLNWKKEVAYGACIVIGAWWLYDSVIRHRASLLPNPQELATEVWLLSAVFLFYLFNELGGGTEGTRERKERFVLRKAERLRKRFKAELLAGIPGVNRKLEALILAVLVYESFNRPFPARVAEYLAFPFGRSRTLGIMQVTTDRLIGDRESVRQGISRIVESWKEYRDQESEWDTLRQIAREYNPDNDYVDEVASLTGTIFAGLFGESEDSLSTYRRLMGPEGKRLC